MKKSQKIAVLLGGCSSERDVSIASGVQVISALRDRGFVVIAVDPAVGILDSEVEAEYFSKTVGLVPPVQENVKKNLVGSLDFIQNPQLGDVDLYFIALHGGEGEDGTIQAALNKFGKKFTGTGHLGSARAMNKNIAKRYFVDNGIPTPAWRMTGDTLDGITKETYPLVVKPCSQGSTVGLSMVRDEAAFAVAIQKAARYDSEVMIETFVAGRELTVGVLNDKALAVGEIILDPDSVFDYDAKYQGKTREVFPALISASLARKAQDYALRAHKALALDGYSRVDFRLDADGKLWCLEVNTLPGLTKTSLLPQSAAASGIEFGELCEVICNLAL